MTVAVLCSDAARSWSILAKLGSVGWLLPVLLALYTVLAMKRVFGRSWPGTLVKAVALLAVYMVVLSFTFGGVVLYAALQL